MVSLNDIKQLNSELENAVINLSGHHGKMNLYRNFYLHSAFYERKAGQAPNQNDPTTNLLRVFADKNIGYISGFPNIKVPVTGADPTLRQNASTREKICYAVHRKNLTHLLQTKWAFDSIIFSQAIAETVWDMKRRCVSIRRYDPRFCYWQYSNDNDDRVIAFWAVFPITKDEAFRRYGVTPTADPLSGVARSEEPWLHHIDGREWFTMAIRWDEDTRTAWIGNKIIEEPHKHMMGTIPVDICRPFHNADTSGQGAFYLEPLIPYQAELNEVIKRRGKIIRRMSAPVVYARGLMGKRLDEVEAQLAKPGGGFIGLAQQGELGLLQVNDTKMLDEHEKDIIDHMMKVSGFSAAAFGESVGANTSGDALAMYFTPTQKLIDCQNIHWKAFYESINAKILRLYDKFGKINETFTLDGYSPNGTLLPISDEAGDTKMEYQRGSFSVTFDRTVIDGNYTTIVIPPSVTPKNELEEKRIAIEAVTQKFYSRTTGYEEFGILSPEDELALLNQEQSDPLLNPDGTSKIMASLQSEPPAAQPMAAGGDYAA